MPIVIVLAAAIAAAAHDSPAPAEATGGSQQPEPTPGGSPFARLLLLPDISAIGDFAAAYDTLDIEKQSPRAERDPKSAAHRLKLQFQELELGFQSVIDPYARADVFVSFEEGSVNVEEAYLTTLALPAGFQLRAGKFRSPVGRLNQEHPHTWDFVDAPLALSRVVSSAEALLGPGMDIAWLAPLPWFAELHAALQATSPEFNSSERLTGIAHLKQYVDVGDAAVVGAGLTALSMEGAGPESRRDLAAVDAYVKLRPVGGRAYVALQGEGFVRRVARGADPPVTAGAYVHAVWRPDAYFGYGLRYDVARAAVGAGAEQRASALLSWFPSEFQKIRVQLSYDRLPTGTVGVEAILHLEFIIGAHGAHPF